MKRIAGRYETLGNTNFFIPDALPPHDPPLIFDNLDTTTYGNIMHMLGMLNGIASRIPAINRFIKSYVIKEAMLSSAIEGIHTTLLEAFTAPFETKPSKDTQLVMQYTQAVHAALHLMHIEGLPLSNRVLLRAHAVLLAHEQRVNPGNYRTQSVHVGNLIPCPAPQIASLMGDLERYINSDNGLPLLIKAGLAHVQFETIHPFADGNGRIGRLLIILMLIQNKLLSAPILYPSLYFKKKQADYYLHLDSVRTNGDFEGWINFYLHCMYLSCQDAYKRILDIEQLEQLLTQQIITKTHSARIQKQLTNALSVLFMYPIIDVATLAKQLGVSTATAKNIINHCIDAKIVSLTEQQKRNRLYQFNLYLQLLEKEYIDL